jgi:hypothetical protein
MLYYTHKLRKNWKLKRCMNETFKDKIKIQIIGNRENGFKEQDKTYNAIMVMELDEEP